MDTTQIRALGACSEALDWLEAHDGSLYDAWRRCDRGDWLLWLAARVGIDRRLVVLAACDCAEPALVYVPEGEERPRVAIETARRWAAGEATIADVNAAYGAAAVAKAAYCAAAAAAVVAAYADANAANIAADAADADNVANGVASLAHSARLVRRRIPWALMRDALMARRAA